MTESYYEARGILRLIERGVLSVEDARELIYVNPAQQAFLRKTLGLVAEIIIEYRQQVLAEFELLLAANSKRSEAVSEVRT